MNDKELESLLMEEVLDDAFDDEVVKYVNPWKESFWFIMLGLANTTIRFSSIDKLELLPLFGIVIMLLGFRGLKAENKWFMAGYVCTTAYLLYALVIRLISASLWNNEILSMWFFESGMSTYTGLILTGIIYVCIWRAIISAENKAGITLHSISPMMLVIWYVLLVVAGLLGISGMLSFVVMAGGYIVIIVGISNVYKEMDRIGYGFKASKIRVPNLAIIIIVFAIYGLSMLIMITNNYYPMEWKEIKEALSDENEQIKEIKSNLMELGVPKNVLEDMKEEDILACEGAIKVHIYTEDLPLNEGYERTEQRSDGVWENYTAYDHYYLSVTNIAVQLSEDESVWRMIYHFDYNDNIKFKGIEVIKISEYAFTLGEAWINGNISGQVLYEKSGKRFASDYFSLENEDYSYVNFIGNYSGSDIFARYSYDVKADDCSGYISYEIEGMIDDFLESGIDVDYYHQDSYNVYSATTASEIAASGPLGYSKADNLIKESVMWERTMDKEVER